MKRYQRSLWGPDIKEFIYKNQPACNERTDIYAKQLVLLRKNIKKELSVAYFLFHFQKMDNLLTIYKSLLASRDLATALILALEKDRKGIDDNWEKVFKRYINETVKRLEYVWKVIRINLRLTEYYPYFQERGIECLMDFEGLTDEALRPIFDDFLEYKKTHQKAIYAHMKNVRPEIEALEKERAINKAKDEAEKEARKARRKAERDEVKLVKEGEKAHRKRLTEQRRSMAYYERLAKE